MLARIVFRRIIPASLHSLKYGKVHHSIHLENLIPRISQCCTNTHTRRCMYSQEVGVRQETMNVDFEYVQRATENNNILIVDVREPDEIKEHGKIPNSVNIPLGNITQVLSTMSESDFKKTYNRAKPTTNTEMIFYCMIGKRSGKAQQSATDLGYKNAKNYVGSWNDWAAKKQ